MTKQPGISIEQPASSMTQRPSFNVGSQASLTSETWGSWLLRQAKQNGKQIVKSGAMLVGLALIGTFGYAMRGLLGGKSENSAKKSDMERGQNGDLQVYDSVYKSAALGNILQEQGDSGLVHVGDLVDGVDLVDMDVVSRSVQKGAVEGAKQPLVNYGLNDSSVLALTVNNITVSRGGSLILSANNLNTTNPGDPAGTDGSGLIHTLVERGEIYDYPRIAYSPKEEIIASAGSKDKAQPIKLWNATTGALMCELVGHTRGVVAVVFSQDGAKIATGGSDHTLRIWDLNSRVLERTIVHTGWVFSVAFNNDRTLLASGTTDPSNIINIINIFHTGNGTLVRALLGHTNHINGLVFSPDGTKIFSGGHDDTIKIWDVGTGLLLRTFSAGGWVDNIVINKAGTMIVAAVNSWFINGWNTTDGSLVFRINQRRTSFSFAFNPIREDILASGSSDNTVNIWKLADNSLILLRQLFGHTSYTSRVAFSPDGTKVVSGDYDVSIKLWTTTAGVPFYTISNIKHCHFERISAPGVHITTFLRTESNNGEILFVHDGGTEAPMFDITVSNVVSTTDPVPALVNFLYTPPTPTTTPIPTSSPHINHSPRIVTNNFNIERGKNTVVITRSMLAAQDADSSDAELTFIISNMRHGRFILSAVQNAASAAISATITSFTPRQIDLGQLILSHDGSVSLAFDIAVTDGKNTTRAVPAKFNQQLVLNVAEQAGVGVGSGGGLLFIGGVVVFGIWKCRSARKNKGKVYPTITAPSAITNAEEGENIQHEAESNIKDAILNESTGVVRENSALEASTTETAPASIIPTLH